VANDTNHLTREEHMAKQGRNPEDTWGASEDAKADWAGETTEGAKGATGGETAEGAKGTRGETAKRDKEKGGA
jgi:hypothetical protein